MPSEKVLKPLEFTYSLSARRSGGEELPDMPPEGINQDGPEADHSYDEHLWEHFFQVEIFVSLRLLSICWLQEGWCNFNRKLFSVGQLVVQTKCI